MKPRRLLKLEKVVATAAGVTVEMINGRSREMNVAYARAVIWHFAHRWMGYSYPRLGAYYGRNHTTILACVRYVETKNKSDLSRIRKKLRTKCPEALTAKTGPDEARGPGAWKF